MHGTKAIGMFGTACRINLMWHSGNNILVFGATIGNQDIKPRSTHDNFCISHNLPSSTTTSSTTKVPSFSKESRCLVTLAHLVLPDVLEAQRNARSVGPTEYPIPSMLRTMISGSLSHSGAKMKECGSIGPFAAMNRGNRAENRYMHS